MAFVYWNDNYWSANYWQEDYWQETPNDNTVEPGVNTLTLTALSHGVVLDVQDYFNDNYFNPNYFSANYFAESNVVAGGQTVNQVAAGSLSFATFQAFVSLDQEVMTPTEGLTLSSFAVDAANNVTANATTEALDLTAFDVSADNAGYVEGSINLSVFPSSTFSFTDGVEVELETLSLNAQSPVAVDYDTNIVVSVTSTEALSLTSFPVTAANPVSVLPVTLSLTLTEYAVTTGFGQLIQQETDSLALNALQASVTATNKDVGEVTATRPRLTLSELMPSVSGLKPTIGVPPSTFIIDQIINGTATTNVPSNYLICDRTGFKIKVSDGLREEWDGTMVRAKSYEARHSQDFVRSRPSSLTGSKRPEQDDEFISDRFPAGVTADDL